MAAAVMLATGAALYGLHLIFELTGWQLALGFAVGTAAAHGAFRLHYGWWPDFNADNQDASNRKLPRL